jgi:hypothetical protein
LVITSHTFKFFYAHIDFTIGHQTSDITKIVFNTTKRELIEETGYARDFELAGSAFSNPDLFDKT